MRKIAINTCAGDFQLSDEAAEMLIARGCKYINRTEGSKYVIYKYDDEYEDVDMWNYRRVEARSDPILIEVIEELGADRASSSGNIKIFEVPDDIEVHIEHFTYGWERIAEKHRKWE